MVGEFEELPSSNNVCAESGTQKKITVRKTLKNLIMSIIIMFKQGCINFLMFYLITGENTALIEDEKNKILSEFKDIPFENSTAASLNEFIHATEACDMFSPQKGIICINPKWLKKVEKNNIASLIAKICETHQ